MILHDKEFFKDTNGLNDLDGHASGESVVRDTVIAGQLDEPNHKVWLNVYALSTHVGCTSPAITVKMQDIADNSTFADVVTLVSAKTITRGKMARILLPEGIRRYSKAVWTVTGSPTSGGAINVFFSEQ